jgi:AraC-like DNA-binding protein
VSITMTQTSIRVLSTEELISSRSASTDHVRVEFLRCSSATTLEWNIARPEVSLMWVRDKGSNAKFTLAGHQSDSIAPGRANFWFFPEGFDAHGELTGNGAYDCAGVFVDPSFLPSTVNRSLVKAIAGFSHDALGRAFDTLAGELIEPDEVLPLFTEGWAMQALAYVARASMTTQSGRTVASSGLAPWQLRRAQELFRSDLSENLSLDSVAQACKLSASHFARAFKGSTGLPPHQWVMATRIEMARGLLTNSAMPLAEIAGACGFADQSHFSRIFARIMDTSPGAWRRQYKG